MRGPKRIDSRGNHTKPVGKQAGLGPHKDAVDFLVEGVLANQHSKGLSNLWMLLSTVRTSISGTLIYQGH